jgi:hypothetical protein
VSIHVKNIHPRSVSAYLMSRIGISQSLKYIWVPGTDLVSKFVLCSSINRSNARSIAQRMLAFGRGGRNEERTTF